MLQENKIIMIEKKVQKVRGYYGNKTNRKKQT